MSTSLISIKDVASAQFEFRVDDWAGTLPLGPKDGH